MMLVASQTERSVSVRPLKRLTALPVVKTTDGTAPETLVIGDVNATRTLNGTITNVTQILQSGILNNLSFTSATPNVALVGDDGLLVYVSDGLAKIIVDFPDGEQHIFYLRVSREGEQMVFARVSFVTGSFAKLVSDTVEALVAAHPFASGQPLFAPYSPTSPIWNANSIIADFPQKTAMAFWNSTGGNTRAGVAITKRHIMLVPHFPISVGAEVRFLQADGTVVSRTIAAVSDIDYARTGFANDTRIGLLSSDLPVGIVPMSVLPNNWTDSVPSVAGGQNWRFPAFYGGQDKNFKLRNYRLIDNFERFIYAVDATGIEPSGYYSGGLRIGDSGSPNCIAANTELVWIGNHTGLTYGDCPSLTQVNAAISAVGNPTGATVSVVDLTNFAFTVPVNDTPPVISGLAEVGQTLSLINDSWSESPTSFAYIWKRDDVAISGATSATYIPVSADLGADITCSKTATNAAGTSAAVTSAAAEVMDGDATAYIAAVVAAKGSDTSSIQKTAINNFFIGEKSASRYSSLKRLYLPIWANAAANAKCMVSATSGTFVGGVTHGAGFVQGDGSTGYFDTAISPLSAGIVQDSGSLFIGIFEKDSRLWDNRYFIGSRDNGNPSTGETDIYSGRGISSTALMGRDPALPIAYFTDTANDGLYVANRISGIGLKLHVLRASGIISSPPALETSAISNRAVFVGALNNGGVPILHTDAKIFASGMGTSFADDAASDAFSLALKNLWETCTGLTLP